MVSVTCILFILVKDSTKSWKTKDMKTLWPGPSQAEGKATSAWILRKDGEACSLLWRGPGDNPHPPLISKDKEFSWSYHKFISMCLQPSFLTIRPNLSLILTDLAKRFLNCTSFSASSGLRTTGFFFPWSLCSDIHRTFPFLQKFNTTMLPTMFLGVGHFRSVFPGMWYLLLISIYTVFFIKVFLK